MSFVESPTYWTAQLLSKFLTPFTSLAPQKLKNSSDAKQFLENIVIPDDQLLVSFDFKSLFTSVPTDSAHQQVREVLMNNQDLLHQHTSLSIEEILELLTLCLNAAVLQWQDQIYQQVHGTPMGSPISVVLAELFMQKLEEEIFLNGPYQPIFWKRYLDDIITVLPRDLIHVFLDYINSVNEHITVTVETETNNFLAYLDLNLIRKEDGHLMFDVYRKPTYRTTFWKMTVITLPVHKNTETDRNGPKRTWKMTGTDLKSTGTDLKSTETDSKWSYMDWNEQKQTRKIPERTWNRPKRTLNGVIWTGTNRNRLEKYRNVLEMK